MHSKSEHPFHGVLSATSTVVFNIPIEVLIPGAQTWTFNSRLGDFFETLFCFNLEMFEVSVRPKLVEKLYEEQANGSRAHVEVLGSRSDGDEVAGYRIWLTMDNTTTDWGKVVESTINAIYKKGAEAKLEQSKTKSGGGGNTVAAVAKNTNKTRIAKMTNKNQYGLYLCDLYTTDGRCMDDKRSVDEHPLSDTYNPANPEKVFSAQNAMCKFTENVRAEQCNIANYIVGEGSFRFPLPDRCYEVFRRIFTYESLMGMRMFGQGKTVVVNSENTREAVRKRKRATMMANRCKFDMDGSDSEHEEREVRHGSGDRGRPDGEGSQGSEFGDKVDEINDLMHERGDEVARRTVNSTEIAREELVTLNNQVSRMVLTAGGATDGAMVLKQPSMLRDVSSANSKRNAEIKGRAYEKHEDYEAAVEEGTMLNFKSLEKNFVVGSQTGIYVERAIDWWFLHAPTHVVHRARYRIDPDLSVFANMKVMDMLSYEMILTTSTSHRELDIISIFQLSAFEHSYSLKSNVFATGEHSTGKSKALEEAEKFLIPGLAKRLIRQTQNANSIDDDMCYGVRYFHEAPPVMLGIDPKGGSTGADAGLKDILTGQKHSVETLVFEEGTSKRISRVAESDQIGAMILSSNADFGAVDPALQSRFFHIRMPDNNRDGKRVTQLMYIQKMFDDLTPDRLYTQMQTNNFLLFWAERLIQANVLFDVDLTVMNVLFNEVSAFMERRGIDMSDPRPYTRLRNTCRTLTLQTAIEFRFHSEYARIENNHHKAFKLVDLLDIQPALVCSEEIFYFSFTLLRDEWQHPLKVASIRKMAEHLFRYLAEGETMFARSHDTSMTNTATASGAASNSFHPVGRSRAEHEAETNAHAPVMTNDPDNTDWNYLAVKRHPDQVYTEICNAMHKPKPSIDHIRGFIKPLFSHMIKTHRRTDPDLRKPVPDTNERITIPAMKQEWIKTQGGSREVFTYISVAFLEMVYGIGVFNRRFQRACDIPVIDLFEQAVRSTFHKYTRRRKKILLGVQLSYKLNKDEIRYRERKVLLKRRMEQRQERAEINRLAGWENDDLDEGDDAFDVEQELASAGDPVPVIETLPHIYKTIGVKPNPHNILHIHNQYHQNSFVLNAFGKNDVSKTQKSKWLRLDCDLEKHATEMFLDRIGWSSNYDNGMLPEYMDQIHMHVHVHPRAEYINYPDDISNEEIRSHRQSDADPSVSDLPPNRKREASGGFARQRRNMRAVPTYARSTSDAESLAMDTNLGGGGGAGCPSSSPSGGGLAHLSPDRHNGGGHTSFDLDVADAENEDFGVSYSPTAEDMAGIELPLGERLRGINDVAGPSYSRR